LSGALAPEAKESAVDTIYFGGGTPSLLEPSALAKILDTLGTVYIFKAAEITLEADPETITAEKAESWLAAGFNRISLGVQSFNDRELQATGRMHRRADIYNATKILRTAGFHNISMDLIAGLPHQTRESWETSFTELLDLRPEHISIYMLEVDESSHLGKESLAGGTRYSAAAIPSDDAQAEFYESACARLAAAGYEHYEISNWALPGRRSRHNLKYWRREPYLGFGAGAHSFDGKTRWANVHDSAQYVAAIEQGISAREQIEPVTMEQALEEEFFLGLRQLEGIDLARIDREYIAGSNGTGARLAAIRQQIDALRSQGLVHLGATRLRLNSNRLTVSSSILAELLA
jgi:oxygen-independent coproporphyrinogen-3 oxidase